jgi:hypothetical protein
MRFGEFQREVRARANLKNGHAPTPAQKLKEAFSMLLEMNEAQNRRILELEELLKAPWQTSPKQPDTMSASGDSPPLTAAQSVENPR